MSTSSVDLSCSRRLRSGRIIGPAENILVEQIDHSLSSGLKNCSSTTFDSEPQHTAREVQEREITRNMADGMSSLLPNPFYGKPDEDVDEFLRTIDLWVTLRKADEDTGRSALSLLLRGSASTWFHTQPQNVTESFHELKAALLERYGPRKELAWKSTANLWQMQQLKGQSTDDFVATVIKAGRKIGIDDSQLVYIALNGLRPELRQHVIQHPVRNLDELLQWGKVTEISLQDASEEDSATSNMAQELAELKNEVRQLRIHAVKPLHPSRASSPASDVLPSSRRAQTSFDSSPVEPIQSFQESRVNDGVPSNRQQTRHQQPHRVQSQHRPTQHVASSPQQGISRCNNCGADMLFRNFRCQVPSQKRV